MPDPFQTIQQTVSAREVAEHYGIKVNARNMALCPFHNERTPSLHFRGARYYCFGCGASGDATDLVRELFGMTYAEAARRISDDFNLGLDFGTPATPEQRKKAKQAAAEREAVKKLKAQFAISFRTAPSYTISFNRILYSEVLGTNILLDTSDHAKY